MASKSHKRTRVQIFARSSLRSLFRTIVHTFVSNGYARTFTIKRSVPVHECTFDCARIQGVQQRAFTASWMDSGHTIPHNQVIGIPFFFSRTLDGSGNENWSNRFDSLKQKRDVEILEQRSHVGNESP